MQWALTNFRKGVWRTYLLLAVPWIICFGYIAYTEHNESVRSYEGAVVWMKQLTTGAKDKAFREEVGASYLKQIDLHFARHNAAREQRNRALLLLPLIPVGLPILWVAFLLVGGQHRQVIDHTQGSSRGAA